MKKLSILLFSMTLLLISCNKDDDNTPTSDEPQLIFKYTFDNTQERLDNFGNPSTIPSGNAAQSPTMNSFGVHSIELINSPYTLPYQGSIVYQGAETNIGGARAIDFEKEILVSDGEVFTSVPISSVTPGTYTYLRNSLAYQNGDIAFLYNDPTFGEFNLTSTIVSFLGFDTYIKDHKINTQTETVNANRAQGYWAFEVTEPTLIVESGQAAGTTVPNILDSTSPIPLGSCLVTGQIANGLTITGNETEDIVIEISVSTNNSFEWTEVNFDGKYEPAAGETVVDMGTRGIKVTIL